MRESRRLRLQAGRCVRARGSVLPGGEEAPSAYGCDATAQVEALQVWHLHDQKDVWHYRRFSPPVAYRGGVWEDEDHHHTSGLRHSPPWRFLFPECDPNVARDEKAWRRCAGSSGSRARRDICSGSAMRNVGSKIWARDGDFVNHSRLVVTGQPHYLLCRRCRKTKEPVR